MVLPELTPERNAASPTTADVTYGTNNEFGFDYLRDNMAGTIDDLRPARHQLRRSSTRSTRSSSTRPGPRSSSPARLRTSPSSGTTSSPRSGGSADATTIDYEFDEKKRTVSDARGRVSTRVEDHLGIDNLYDVRQHAADLLPQQRDQGQGAVPQGQATTSSSRARCSSSTSTPDACCSGRRYNEGLHQAIEAKEGGDRSARSTRPSPRSPCRTTSGSTTSSAA